MHYRHVLNANDDVIWPLFWRSGKICAHAEVQMQFHWRHTAVTLVLHHMFLLLWQKQLVIALWGLWNWRTPPPHWRNLARDAEAGKAPTARWMDEHVTLLKHSRWCGCSGLRVTADHTSSDLDTSAISQIVGLGTTLHGPAAQHREYQSPYINYPEPLTSTSKSPQPTSFFRASEIHGCGILSDQISRNRVLEVPE
jgi:hypothetical protein